MRKLIYKLFSMTGVVAAAFGLNNSVHAAVSPVSDETVSVVNAVDSSEKLYFADVINGTSDSQMFVRHYSHSSHASHSSHRSHYSHVSSR